MKQRMRITLVAGLLLATATAATAQNQPMADDNAAANPAMKSPDRMLHAPLAKGHNSFTKGEAVSRLQKAGYRHITGLTMDQDGLWQAQATKHGSAVHVALDYKGNVGVQ